MEKRGKRGEKARREEGEGEKVGEGREGEGRGGKKARCLHTTVSLELAATNNLDQSPLLPNDIAISKPSAADATTT